MLEINKLFWSQVKLDEKEAFKKCFTSKKHMKQGFDILIKLKNIF